MGVPVKGPAQTGREQPGCPGIRASATHGVNKTPRSPGTLRNGGARLNFGSGRHEIYLAPFPNVAGGRWQISRDGGTKPLWAPSGRELFYVTYDGRLMAAPVATETTYPRKPGGRLRRALYLRSARAEVRYLERRNAFPDGPGSSERRNRTHAAHRRPQLDRGAETPRSHRKLRKYWPQVGLFEANVASG